ncbi:MAG: T9SS type A sorting domain-containing protein, partial [Ignavibacteriota bacterium]
AANSSWIDITPDTERVIHYNDIIAYPDGTVFLATSEKGVLRSDDNGVSWRTKNSGQIDPITLKGDSSAFLLAEDGIGGICVATSSGRVYRSTDKGESWKGFANPVPKGKQHVATMVSLPNGYVLVGNFGNAVVGGDLYLTKDNGVTWDSVYHKELGEDYRNNVEKLIRVPGSNVLFMNAHGPTLRSLNFGMTWEVMDSNKRGDETFSMVYRNGSLFQSCEPDGIFLSTNDGKDWVEKNNGLLAEYMRGMAINSKNKVFGITEYGLWRSTDSGDNWDMAPEYGEDYFPSIYINHKDYIYIGTSKGLYRSKDDGESLDHLIINTVTTDTLNPIYQVGDNGFGKLFCATNDFLGFMYSLDDGDHWTRILGPFQKDSIVKTFAFSGDTMILATAFTNNYYRSLDRGVSWHSLPNHNEIHGTWKLLIHGDGSYLDMVNGAQGGVFRSTDEGQNWTHVFPPENFIGHFTEYYDMLVDSKGNIIVSTDSGVYRSAEGSANFSQWYSVSDGLSANDYPFRYIHVSAIVENSNTHVFFAGSRGLGVYKSVPFLGVPSSQSSPISVMPIHVYPNPSQGFVNISFTTENRGEANVDLFDQLGRRVTNLYQGTPESGETAINFDGSALPTGTYMLVLQQNGNTSTSWITLVK